MIDPRYIARLITEDPDVFNEAQFGEFEGKSTTTVPKAMHTLGAETFSGRLSGKGLCVYLVGDPSSGLDRHVREKENLGFEDYQKHVIVEIGPKTAVALAQACQERYPGITVIQGDLRNVSSTLGHNNIEHLDFDGTQNYSIETSTFMKDLMGQVRNIHLVGATRGSPQRFLEQSGLESQWNAINRSKLSPGRQGQWKLAIDLDLQHSAKFSGYKWSWVDYHSGGEVKSAPRSITILTIHGDYSGQVSPEDYQRIVTYFNMRLHGHIGSISLDPVAIRDVIRRVDARYGRVSPLNNRHPSEAEPPLDTSEEDIQRWTDDEDVWINLNKITNVKEGTISPEDGRDQFGGSPMYMLVLDNDQITSQNVSGVPLDDFVKWEIEGLNNLYSTRRQAQDRSDQEEIQAKQEEIQAKQEAEEKQRLIQKKFEGFVKQLKYHPNIEIDESIANILNVPKGAYHVVQGLSSTAQDMIKLVPFINGIKGPESKGKSVNLGKLYQSYEGLTESFANYLELLLEIDFKEPEGIEGIDPYDLKQPLSELPDEDWEVVVEMLKTGEISPSEAFNVGLSKREIENFLQRRVSDIELLEQQNSL